MGLNSLPIKVIQKEKFSFNWLDETMIYQAFLWLAYNEICKQWLCLDGPNNACMDIALIGWKYNEPVDPKDPYKSWWYCHTTGAMEALCCEPRIVQIRTKRTFSSSTAHSNTQNSSVVRTGRNLLQRANENEDQGYDVYQLFTLKIFGSQVTSKNINLQHIKIINMKSA